MHEFVLSASRQAERGVKALDIAKALVDRGRERLRGSFQSIDEVVSQTGLAVPQVLSTISVLEVRRVIRRLSGTMVVRV
jgi:predicted Rossmann fold nucleotide-binding protein DprA/Smf involved in DNA uptake